jgi:hypothetical protein
MMVAPTSPNLPAAIPLVRWNPHRPILAGRVEVVRRLRPGDGCPSSCDLRCWCDRRHKTQLTLCNDVCKSGALNDSSPFVVLADRVTLVVLAAPQRRFTSHLARLWVPPSFNLDYEEGHRRQPDEGKRDVGRLFIQLLCANACLIEDFYHARTMAPSCVCGADLSLLRSVPACGTGTVLVIAPAVLFLVYWRQLPRPD